MNSLDDGFVVSSGSLQVIRQFYFLHLNSTAELLLKKKVKKNPALARLKSTESGFVEYTSSRDELVSKVRLGVYQLI